MAEAKRGTVPHDGQPGDETVLYFGFHDDSRDILRNLGDLLGDDQFQYSPTKKLVLKFRTTADLRWASVLDEKLPVASEMELTVSSMPPWQSLLLPSPGNEVFWQHLVHIAATSENGQWKISARFGELVPSGSFLCSVARMLDGHRINGTGPLAGPTGPGAVYNPGAQFSTPMHESARLVNVRYATRASLVKKEIERRFAGCSAEDEEGSAQTYPFAVDERSVNPIGFTRSASGPTGQLTASGNEMCVESSDRARIILPRSGEITESEISHLRPLCYVRVGAAENLGKSIGLKRAIISLAAAGVPLIVDPSCAAEDHFPPDLAALMSAEDGTRLRDELTREIHSIRLRRSALRQYSMKSSWRRLMNDSGLSGLGDPLISVVLCTRRPSMIQFALQQVERQRDVRLEVLLGLHGISKRDPHVESAVSECTWPISVVELSAEVPFGEALNEVARAASGTVLAKMDDDDWYGPHHLFDSLLAQQYSGAELVGSRIEFIYLQEENLTVCHTGRIRAELPMSMTNSLLTGGTFLFSRGIFDAVGGFKPVPRYVDSELLSSIKNAGGRVFQQHGLNYLYRRGTVSNHTWQAPNRIFLRGSPRTWDGCYFNDLMEGSAAPAVRRTR